MNIEEAFNTAYKLATTDDDPVASIALCREILESDPSHQDARMLLGCLLADSSKTQDIDSARYHFMFAVKSIAAQLAPEAWLEENPLYQLGLLELKNSKPALAAVLFAIDIIKNKTEASHTELKKVLHGESAGQSEEMFSLIEDILRLRSK
ncbi:hypothetical protein [Chitinimonas naiadis]